jgi:hypothetical protein
LVAASIAVTASRILSRDWLLAQAYPRACDCGRIPAVSQRREPHTVLRDGEVAANNPGRMCR